jgi:N-methylhydantoinase B/oxoprolinase/acetone carboxylase alpha subunit
MKRCCRHHSRESTKARAVWIERREEGKRGRAFIIHDGRARKIASKGSWNLEAGDRVRIETPAAVGTVQAKLISKMS